MFGKPFIRLENIHKIIRIMKIDYEITKKIINYEHKTK